MRKSAGRLPDELSVLFLPVQNCGFSIEHKEFPGTLSVSAETLVRAWTELAECVFRAGCRKLVLVEFAWRQQPAPRILSRMIFARGSACSSCSRPGGALARLTGSFPAEELAHGIHAGEIETSLMQTFRPDLVREEDAAGFPSQSATMERDFNWLRAGRPTGFGWMSQDLSTSGAMGNAAAANARKGEACADHGATAFIELLQDIDGFDLTRLKEGPLS